MSLTEIVQETEEARRTIAKSARRVLAHLAPHWDIIGRELNVRLATVPAAESVRIHPGVVLLDLYVLKPATKYTPEKTCKFTVPIRPDVFDAGVQTLVVHLREAFPVRCIRCGINHPQGTVECQLGDVAGLAWRPESPRPRYYIEPNKSLGLFGIDPGTRTLRYAIELSNERIYGVEVTRAKGSTFLRPAPQIHALLVRKISAEIPLIQMLAVGTGGSNHLVSRLSYDPPHWTAVAPKILRQPGSA